MNVKINLSFLKKYTLPVRLIKYQMNTPNKSKKKKVNKSQINSIKMNQLESENQTGILV